MTAMSSDGDSQYDQNVKAFLIEDDNMSDIDFSLPPTSGLEYIRRVRWEAKNIPSAVTANFCTKQYSNGPTVYGNVASVEQTPTLQGFPSAEWQKLQIQNFIELKVSLCAKKNRFRDKKNTCVPTMYDVEAWCWYCLGPRVSTVLFGNSSSVSSNEQSDSHNLLPVEGHLPLLSVVLWLPQTSVEILLSYHSDWIKDLGFSHHQGRWIFALLSCLEKPLKPTTCALLRSLGQLCADFRSDVKHNKFISPLNLIICIVADYFKQKDKIGTGENED